MSTHLLQRLLRFAALLALVMLWVRAVQLYALLPERFPYHFDITGVPDAWAEKRPLTWYALPLIATLLAMAFWVVAPYILRSALNAPDRLNVPDKARFLQLPSEARVRVMGPSVCYLHFIALLTILLFLRILKGSVAVALGTAERMQPSDIGIYVGILLAGIPVLLWAGKQAMDREVGATSVG